MNATYLFIDHQSSGQDCCGVPSQTELESRSGARGPVQYPLLRATGTQPQLEGVVAGAYVQGRARQVQSGRGGPVQLGTFDAVVRGQYRHGRAHGDGQARGQTVGTDGRADAVCKGEEGQHRGPVGVRGWAVDGVQSNGPCTQ